jgi:hypothetical protein
MHGTWFILRWAWAAVVIAYLVLFVIGSRRLQGEAKKRTRSIFGGVVVLIVFRELIWLFGGRPVYRFSVMIVGVAAGIAALFLIYELSIRGPDAKLQTGDDGEGHIQSLKLS